MTAFQPNPEKLTAQQELGGEFHEMTPERRQALGEIGIAIENQKLAGRLASHRYYETEFGVTGRVTDRAAEDAEALKKIMQDLRDKRLPAMENDPHRIIEPTTTPEESAAKILADAKVSWDEVENRIDEGRLL